MLLILECKPDEKLAMTLGIARKSIRHHNDKGQVCNYLNKFNGHKGLIDEDPNSAQPSYLSTCTENSFQLGIRECIHPKGNRIIIVTPRLEEWIVVASKHSNIDMSEFGLSDNPKQLHKEINFKLESFERLLRVLIKCKNAHLLHLKSLLLK